MPIMNHVIDLSTANSADFLNAILNLPYKGKDKGP
jgi:hypothetical protein